MWESIRAIKCSNVLIADLQILASAMLFGLGFIGQRSLSVMGLGPMTTNALRFGLSAVIFTWLRPFIKEGDNHVIESYQGVGRGDADALLPLLISPAGKKGLGGLASNETGKSSMGKLMKYAHAASAFTVEQLNAGYRFVLSRQMLIKWSVTLGVINFAASGFQQWGINDTTASKVGFLAGFDIFLTPIMALCIPSMKHNAGI